MRFNILIFFTFVHFGLFSQDILEKIEVKKISDNVYTHTTYGKVGEKIYPANGMFVIGKNGIVLIDTPWDSNQTRKLLEKIEHDYGKKVKQFVPTHSHRDRMGGIDVILEMIFQ